MSNLYSSIGTRKKPLVSLGRGIIGLAGLTIIGGASLIGYNWNKDKEARRPLEVVAEATQRKKDLILEPLARHDFIGTRNLYNACIEEKDKCLGKVDLVALDMRIKADSTKIVHDSIAKARKDSIDAVRAAARAQEEQTKKTGDSIVTVFENAKKNMDIVGARGAYKAFISRGALESGTTIGMEQYLTSMSESAIISRIDSLSNDQLEVQGRAFLRAYPSSALKQQMASALIERRVKDIGASYKQGGSIDLLLKATEHAAEEINYLAAANALPTKADLTVISDNLKTLVEKHGMPLPETEAAKRIGSVNATIVKFNDSDLDEGYVRQRRQIPLGSRGTVIDFVRQRDKAGNVTAEMYTVEFDKTPAHTWTDPGRYLKQKQAERHNTNIGLYYASELSFAIGLPQDRYEKVKEAYAHLSKGAQSGK